MYVPSNPPSSYSSQFISNELRKIASELSTPTFNSLNLTQLNVAPARPRDGDVYYADGTNWNPGSGAGLYSYLGGSYAKL